MLQELKKDILFIISNGLHPRSKESDAKAIFGEELFLKNSGQQDRLSAMTVKIRNIW